MKKKFSNLTTPITNQDWKQKSEENRIKSVPKELKKIFYKL